MSPRSIWAGALLATLLVHAPLALAQDGGDSAPSAPDPTPDRKPNAPPAGKGAPAAKEKPADDVGDEGDEQPVDRPPPAGKGVVYGVVTDAADGETVIEAKVSVVGSKVTALTDLDGRFRLELPPGSYQIRVFYELHKPARVDQVRVTAGQLSKIDVALEPEKNAVDVIEVETQADTSSVEGQILARKRSAATGDSIGRKEMAKAPDKNAAEAAKRVVGATIEGNRFVFVRGLGERYTNALLDGAPLPSPEPDKQAIPLDLFPTQILDGVVLVKTFTPDVPGDFAGGSVRIATRRYSEQLTLAGGVSLGLNTRSSFARGLDYRGSPTDFLGFSSGSSREKPADLPKGVGTNFRKPDGTFYTKQDIAAFGREINGPMTARERVTPPNVAGTFVASKGWKVGKEGKFGFLSAITYDRKFEVRTNEIIREASFPQSSAEDFHTVKDIRVDRGTDRVNWGLLAGLTYEIDKNDRVFLSGLYSRGADKEAAEYHTLAADERFNEAFDTRLSFVQRDLLYGQLRVEHDFKALNDAHLDYSVSLSRAYRGEPNRTGLAYQFTSAENGLPGSWNYIDDNDSGSHFYSTQTETVVSGAIDWTQPFRRHDETNRMKFGAFFSAKNRDFVAQKVRFVPEKLLPNPSSCPGHAIPRGCMNDFITDDANQGTALTLTQVAKSGDGYGAHLNVFAGYAMVDTQLSRSVRLIAGPRLEASFQALDGFDPAGVGEPVTSEFNDVAVLPAASLVYSPTDKVNVRVSGTKTLARPQLREIAPFEFAPFFGAVPEEGNPDLVNTSIFNADVRFEFFPTLDEVIAVSAFFKNFDDPIERVQESKVGGQAFTWDNVEGAHLFGMEFEGRKSLGFLARALSPFSLVANVTLAQSRVTLDPVQNAIETSKSRPLALQPPFIINAALDFDYPKSGTQARVSYNVVAKRIFAVGRNALPDIYQQARHQLDFVVAQTIYKHVEVKAAVANILDSPYVQTAGSTRSNKDPSDSKGNVLSYYHTGQTFSLGVGLAY